MKLLSSFACMGLLAAQQAYAQEQVVHIPLDCYSESERVFGSKQGTRISDLNILSGLDALNSQLISVTACVDNNTNLISGITTNYGVWNGNEPTDIKRMNIIGNMSGLHKFNIDNAGLTGQQYKSFEKLWWKTASPDDEEYMRNVTDGGASGIESGTDGLVADRFKRADVDRSGALNLKEFEMFWREVRDGERRFKTNENTDYWEENFGEKMMAYFEACASLDGSQELCSQSNYETTVSTIKAWYNQEKMNITGYIYNDVTPSSKWISHRCDSMYLDSEDRLTYLQVDSGNYGVE